MEVGDLVKFIGFSFKRGFDSPMGIVVRLAKADDGYSHEIVADVLWGDGNIGKGLYLNTLEKVNEKR
jgi:hypothetical protein